jgi:hypothetical protein
MNTATVRSVVEQPWAQNVGFEQLCAADRPSHRPTTIGRRASQGDLLTLRRFGWSVSDDTSLNGCGRRIRKGDVGTPGEILKRTVMCRRKWLCPTCGHREAVVQASKWGRELRHWSAGGGSLALLTLTQTHCADDTLSDLWDRADHGWTRLTAGSGWKRVRDTYGLSRYLRVLEVVHHHLSGWNPHVHAVLYLSNPATASQLADLKHTLATRFIDGLQERGGSAAFSGQDLRLITAGTEGAVASYCFKGTTPYCSRDGSRSPIKILADIDATGEGLPLWQEFTGTAYRRTQLSRSHGEWTR